jgi:hypothetical protein
MTALLAQVTPPGVFLTTGRRLLPWTKVDAQPALFLRHIGDRYPERATRLPVKVTLECEAWIYSSTGPNANDVPDVVMNGLLDVVESALLPPPGREAQTLGGLVSHAWIEGTVDIHPGDLDGQAIAIIPIKVLVPSLAGS